MQLPFFYTTPLNNATPIVVLDEETSKHIVMVLRMQNGRNLKLTDGLGHVYTATIVDAHKKKCSVQILETRVVPKPTKQICIAVSLVKNNSRFEWFLEKATEMGVQQIVPLLCTRTEKQHFKYERMNGILISAMLQSQQAWLPQLLPPQHFETFVQQALDGYKFIAHCEPSQKTSLRSWLDQHQFLTTQHYATMLIGPEGDFTPDEISLAIRQQYLPVALGETRLRTETAAMVAAALLCVH
ncbi:RsmE family RNA methyltransferase [Ferruginibacter yonginensis]|uniref:Ribosomal RNA small subunit methyltransferase E n=1 Tax=Ferruginibacter yonginensis TaxID=1310416 RepID=A0ABV8QUL5_9BACT